MMNGILEDCEKNRTSHLYILGKWKVEKAGKLYVSVRLILISRKNTGIYEETKYCKHQQKR